MYTDPSELDFDYIESEDTVRIPPSTVQRGLLKASYEITKDPHGVFKGLFRTWDFGESFAGGVWSTGTVVLDQDGNEYTVQYGQQAGLLRSDGVLFSLDRKHMTFREVS